MPVIGSQTRFREWGFSAAQSAHGTPATPSGRFPWRGTPDVNPNWTEIDDVDVGSIDPVLPPYRTVLDSSVTLEGPLDYDSEPLINSGGVRGGVTPTSSGTAYTWAHQALSLTSTTLDEFSAQWGDNYAADDIRFSDGLIEQITYTIPDDLGPWRVSTQWYFGKADNNVTKAVIAPLGSNLAWVYGADTALYIDSASGSIGSTQISNAVHSGTITITNEIDRKRFMNGSNTRFAVAGFALASRTIEAEFTFTKADAITGSGSTSEIRNFLAADPVMRYLEVKAISPTLIPGSSTPYSLSKRLGGQWMTKGDGEMGGNATVTFTLKNRYDGGLGYAYRNSVVCANATLP